MDRLPVPGRESAKVFMLVGPYLDPVLSSQRQEPGQSVKGEYLIASHRSLIKDLASPLTYRAIFRNVPHEQCAELKEGQSNHVGDEKLSNESDRGTRREVEK